VHGVVFEFFEEVAETKPAWLATRGENAFTGKSSKSGLWCRWFDTGPALPVHRGAAQAMQKSPLIPSAVLLASANRRSLRRRCGQGPGDSKAR
jgi:hypothetical protein